MWECTAFKGCKGHHNGTAKLGTVAQCLWDGFHGDWPENGVIAKMTFWWFKTHVLGEKEESYTDPPSMRPRPPAPEGHRPPPPGHAALAQHYAPPPPP